MKRIGRILLCILMITVLFGISIMGNFVVKSENKSKEKKRTAITKEEMKEWAAPDEETLKYYDLGKFSTTLPVIYMNTKGQKILKENAIWGNIALLDRNEEAQSIFSVPNSIYRATIKYRGASSYSKFDKKQYRIEFYKNNKDSTKKVSLAGMGANSEWVLNGPYLDKTLIRNKWMGSGHPVCGIVCRWKVSGSLSGGRTCNKRRKQIASCRIWSVVWRNCICGKQR